MKTMASVPLLAFCLLSMALAADKAVSVTKEKPPFRPAGVNSSRLTSTRKKPAAMDKAAADDGTDKPKSVEHKAKVKPDAAKKVAAEPKPSATKVEEKSTHTRRHRAETIKKQSTTRRDGSEPIKNPTTLGHDNTKKSRKKSTVRRDKSETIEKQSTVKSKQASSLLTTKADGYGERERHGASSTRKKVARSGSARANRKQENEGENTESYVEKATQTEARNPVSREYSRLRRNHIRNKHPGFWREEPNLSSRQNSMRRPSIRQVNALIKDFRKRPLLYQQVADIVLKDFDNGLISRSHSNSQKLKDVNPSTIPLPSSTSRSTNVSSPVDWREIISQSSGSPESWGERGGLYSISEKPSVSGSDDDDSSSSSSARHLPSDSNVSQSSGSPASRQNESLKSGSSRGTNDHSSAGQTPGPERTVNVRYPSKIPRISIHRLPNEKVVPDTSANTHALAPDGDIDRTRLANKIARREKERQFQQLKRQKKTEPRYDSEPNVLDRGINALK